MPTPSPRSPFAPLTRREFLHRTGATVVAVGALPLARGAEAAPAAPALPPHLALDVPGLHAYPLEHSITAGGTLELCVSSSVPYRLSICRLGPQIDDPADDAVLARFDEAPAHPQPIHPGSYIFADKNVAGPLRAITLECWVRPWNLTRLQGVISQEDKESDDGFALGIGVDGYVGFFLGDGVGPDDKVVHRTPAGVLTLDAWHHVVATWDGAKKRVYVDARETGTWDFAGPVRTGPHALRIGAMAQSGLAQHFLDGDIAMPAIYARILGADEVRARFEQRGQKPAAGAGLIACWPLTEERGDRVADVSGAARHGRIINHATWMIGGPGFNADIPRFHAYDPKTDPTRGHGLRLASDDLYDCRWSVTHRWKVPADARPGLHVARFHLDYEGKPREYHCTFIVRRAPNRRKSPIALLLATNTWRAYSGTPFALAPTARHQVWGTGGIESNPRGLPAYNFYRDHASRRVQRPRSAPRSGNAPRLPRADGGRSQRILVAADVSRRGPVPAARRQSRRVERKRRFLARVVRRRGHRDGMSQGRRRRRARAHQPAR